MKITPTTNVHSRRFFKNEKVLFILRRIMMAKKCTLKFSFELHQNIYSSHSALFLLLFTRSLPIRNFQGTKWFEVVFDNGKQHTDNSLTRLKEVAWHVPPFFFKRNWFCKELQPRQRSVSITSTFGVRWTFTECFH